MLLSVSFTDLGFGWCAMLRFKQGNTYVHEFVAIHRSDEAILDALEKYASANDILHRFELAKAT